MFNDINRIERYEYLTLIEYIKYTGLTEDMRNSIVNSAIDKYSPVSGKHRPRHLITNSIAVSCKSNSNHITEQF